MDDPCASPDAASTRPWLRDARRLVVKIGSRALVRPDGGLDVGQIERLSAQMAALHAEGREVVCVSSGAVAAGLRELGLDRRPRDLPSLQAAAAIGQARLVGLYREQLARAGIAVGQVLLTHADLRARDRHLNARNTLSRLLVRRVLPVVNENDTVAVDEIRVGDNDTLSALVSVLVRADVLVMLTSADGLLTAPPGTGAGTLVREVERIDERVRAMAGGAGSDVATGGMRTKLDAAEIVTRGGEHAVIANARTPDVLRALADGAPLGTAFAPHPQRLRGRQRWIAFFDRPRGSIVVDDGAARALAEAGGSLLAIGIAAIEGDFDRGAPVRLVDGSGREIARGLTNYGADDLRRIRGCRSARIAEILGACEYEAVVHRDNLVLR